MSPVVPTAEFASLVYGRRGVEVDDPAESFHEASRLYPNVAPGRLETLMALRRSPELQATANRSSRTHDHRTGIDLPPSIVPPTSFASLLDARGSAAPDAALILTLADLGAVLGACYVARPRGCGVVRRPVPSAGALYPLELYVLTLAISGIEPAVFHYNPFSHRLETLGKADRTAVGAALVDASLAERGAALLVVTAMFWRSRFKYGLRGYRFALLEAGHVIQNAVLVAAALGLPALPIGGFYDRKLDSLVGADGLDEATVYALLLGGSP